MIKVVFSIALIAAIALLLVLVSYDKSLGHNPTNQTVLYSLIGVAILLLLYNIFGGSEKLAGAMSGMFLTALVALPVLAFMANQWSYRQSDEQVAVRQTQQNVRCVLRKLSIGKTPPYLRARINMMRVGDTYADHASREIEAYLGIKIHENCEYDITRPNGGRLPPAGTPFPDIDFRTPSSVK